MISGENNSSISTTLNINAIPIVVDYNVSQITPYLYVTAEYTARQFQKLFSNGIGCVINVAHELPQILFPPQSGIESLKYPIEDNPLFPVARYFDTVVDRIAVNVASNRRTLLYCHHGRSRSITFILAYLIKHHQLPLSTAFAIVKQKRQLALPNVGFWTQLRSYELYQQQQQQQQNSTAISRNFHDSLAYGQNVLNKISGGIEQILVQNPIVNAFTTNIHQINRPSHLHPYYHTIRQKPLVYSHPYHVRYPQRIYHRRHF